MTRCPRGRRVIDECPRKVYTGKVNACQPCIDQHRECVAVVAKAMAAAEKASIAQYVPDGAGSLCAASESTWACAFILARAVLSA